MSNNKDGLNNDIRQKCENNASYFYLKLKNDYGFFYDEISQLVYLYIYLKRRNEQNKFLFIVNDLKTNGIADAQKMQEIIKCITHNIPYYPLMHKEITKDVMIEIRRFMEDTDCGGQGKNFLFIAEKLGTYFDDKDKIYEFRRFNKSDVPISFEQDVELFKLCTQTKGGIPWQVISSLYDVYTSHGFDAMKKFFYQWNNNESKKQNNEAAWEPMKRIEMMFAASGIEYERNEL